MSRKVSFEEVYTAYKRWVINNPNVATDLENVATWSSYLISGKYVKSSVITELIYSLSKLLTLFNDRLIREAYGTEEHYYGLRDQIKLWLTVIHYCEVFIELVVKNKYGNRCRWTVITFLQLFKCTTSLVLMFRFKEVTIHHPAIATLQRKEFTQGKDIDENTNSFFKLQRSGRVMRCVDGAPPVAFRDWQPVKIKDTRMFVNADIKDLLYAELLHVLKPLIHLTAIRMFSTTSWKQWIIALGIDLASIRLYNRHIKDLSYEQRLEISRRKLSLVLYLLRSPMYYSYSKNTIENMLNATSDKIPLMSHFCGPIIQYLKYWQDMYSCMWVQ